MPNHTRALQVGFLALLAICIAQVAYWYLDQVTYTAETEELILAGYRVDIMAAIQFDKGGVSAEEIALYFPHLKLKNGGEWEISPETMAALDSERERRLYRYRWEAGFFFMVLFSAMGVLWRALWAHDELRRRQENFLAAISHEFKSPLASLRISLESLSLRAPSPQRLTKLVNRMGSDVDRLEGMVSNLLDTNRLESGRLELDPRPIDLGTALRNCIEEIRHRAELEGIALEVQRIPAVHILVDQEAFRIVINNLLSNAVKATRRIEDARIGIDGRIQGNQVMVSITDNGRGFAPEEGPRLFDKFYRPGDEMRRKGGGTGLGLYLVQGLVRLSQGSISAHSDGPGTGATFTLTWPLVGGM